MRGEFGIDARAMHHIERGFGLGKKFVPKVQGKVLIKAAETGNEVIFECANCTFSGVAPMDTGRDKLEVDGFFAEKGLQGFGALVVEALELGTMTGGDEAGVNRCERQVDAVGSAVFHWLDEDAIAVKVVNDEDIIVAGAGCHDEAVGLIGMDLPGDWVGFDGSGVTVMRPSVFGVAGRVVVCCVGAGVGRERWCHGGVLWLGGSLVSFLGLVHVPFDHCNGMG